MTQFAVQCNQVAWKMINFVSKTAGTDCSRENNKPDTDTKGS